MDGTGQVLQRMTEEKVKMEEELSRVATTNASLNEQLRTQAGQIDHITNMLEQYQSLGTIEELTRVMDIAENMLENDPQQQELLEAAHDELNEYRELGSIDELEEVFRRVESIMEMQKDLGSPTEMQEFLEQADQALNEYKEYGSPSELNQVFNETESFIAQVRELGTVSELTRVMDLMEQYVPFGTPDEIDRAFSMMESAVGNMKERLVKGEAREVAEAYGVDISIAARLIESLGSVKAHETLSAINESRSLLDRAPSRTDGVGDRYRIDESRDRTLGGNKLNPTGSLGHARNGQQVLKTTQSRIARLFETMNR